MKRILISNGRSPITLDFIRSLSHSDHEIYVSETSNFQLSRFSNCVKKCFIVPSPRFSPKQHVEKLIQLIESNKIDLFIPAWEDVFLISKHLKEFPPSCFVFTSDYTLLHKLHHKGLFIKLLNSLEIKAPQTFWIDSKEALTHIPLSQYALKACYSRASQEVFKITKGDPLPLIDPTPQTPWIAQEWLNGESFCTFSLCHEGHVSAHATYPVDFGSYCLTFRSIDHDPILKWVQDFVKKTNYTGQIAFDFIETQNRELFAIECNPRITSGITLFAKGVDQALFNENSTLIKGDPSIQKQLLLGMLLYGWKSAKAAKKLPLYFNKLFHSKDLTFLKGDPLPFLAQITFLWLKHLYDIRLYKKRLHGAFTHDLDFNGD